MGIQGREVKQSHAVYHEAGQMVGRQTVAQPHCQIERLGVVHLFACSTHAQEYTITDGGYVLLSDKLLGAREEKTTGGVCPACCFFFPRSLRLEICRVKIILC